MMMKRKLCAALLLGFCFDAFAEYSLFGRYDCHGHNPYSDSNYQNQQMILKQNKDTIRIKYSGFPDAQDEIGTGIWDKKTRTLSVIFIDEKIKNFKGVQLYRASKDFSVLEGPWALLNQDKLGMEICEKISVVRAKPKVKTL